jgi:hypothetical protein
MITRSAPIDRDVCHNASDNSQVITIDRHLDCPKVGRCLDLLSVLYEEWKRASINIDVSSGVIRGMSAN